MAGVVCFVCVWKRTIRLPHNQVIGPHYKIETIKKIVSEALYSGGWENFSFNYEDLFRNNGKINIKKKETLEKLQNHFNKVVYGLENHIVSSNTSIAYTQNK